ncbi:four helix bundle protein [Flavobacterium algicola]|nr:four helix bundle protein [Flavobacterium algicola]
MAANLGRDSNNELIRFTSIAVGSLFELQMQLKIEKDISYINTKEFNNLYEDSRKVERMLITFLKKLKVRN